MYWYHCTMQPARFQWVVLCLVSQGELYGVSTYHYRVWTYAAVIAGSSAASILRLGCPGQGHKRFVIQFANTRHLGYNGSVIGRLRPTGK